MERVAFLIEPSNDRIGCMLNPETVTVRRLAGVEPRRVRGGAIAGCGLSDDPLHFTGGGRTEIELSLVFDVDIAGSSVTTGDVRELTGPLWRLTENAEPVEHTYGRPPNVQLVWGKSWCMSIVITAISERFEHFGPDGVPRRSWLRMRLVRVPEPPLEVAPSQPDGIVPDVLDVLAPPSEAAPPDAEVHEVLGTSGTSGDDRGTERLDELAHRYLGNASLWRVLAYLNDVTDPLRLAVGSVLRLPGRARQEQP